MSPSAAARTTSPSDGDLPVPRSASHCPRSATQWPAGACCGSLLMRLLGGGEGNVSGDGEGVSQGFFGAICIVCSRCALLLRSICVLCSTRFRCHGLGTLILHQCCAEIRRFSVTGVLHTLQIGVCAASKVLHTLQIPPCRRSHAARQSGRRRLSDHRNARGRRGDAMVRRRDQCPRMLECDHLFRARGLVGRLTDRPAD